MKRTQPPRLDGGEYYGGEQAAPADELMNSLMGPPDQQGYRSGERDVYKRRAQAVMPSPEFQSVLRDDEIDPEFMQRMMDYIKKYDR